jgi:hypothetical protein
MSPRAYQNSTQIQFVHSAMPTLLRGSSQARMFPSLELIFMMEACRHNSQNLHSQAWGIAISLHFLLAVGMGQSDRSFFSTGRTRTLNSSLCMSICPRDLIIIHSCCDLDFASAPAGKLLLYFLD